MGQAMIIAVMLFVFISLVVLMGIVGPSLRQKAIVADLLQSRDSYFLAESGTEDVIYRLKNNLPVASNGQTTNISGKVGTTNTVDAGGTKTVTTVADWNGRIRKVSVELNAGVGISFSYGIQTGYGGLILSNNAGINGNVYANGNIFGENGSFITGGAIAANSPSLTADQSNLQPTSPPHSIKFRDTSGTQDLGQKFQVSTTAPLNKLQFYIKKNGSPSSATVKVVNDNGDKPGTTVYASGSLISSQVTTNYSLVDVVLTSNPSLLLNTNYWVVIDNSSQSTTNYYTVAANTFYASGYAKVGQQGGTWNNTSPSALDSYFSVLVGGTVATISGVTIGSAGTGDAWAHIVNNSSIAGNLYCHTGSNNNKSCNTSRSDPSQQPFPISQGNIDQWKTEAESGTIFNGNKTITSTNASLGPMKIVGNLTISNNATLTVTGTIWVTGDVSTSNNVNVRLSPSYGAGSGVIVTDGKINISNNATFSGSGTQGSYLMVLSTSNCPTGPSCGGSNAVSVGNNAGAVILVAQDGTIYFSNNAGAKEVIAGKLSLSNNAVITYESGLIDLNFTNGPSGGWDILNWTETE